MEKNRRSGKLPLLLNRFTKKAVLNLNYAGVFLDSGKLHTTILLKSILQCSEWDAVEMHWDAISIATSCFLSAMRWKQAHLRCFELEISSYSQACSDGEGITFFLQLQIKINLGFQLLLFLTAALFSMWSSSSSTATTNAWQQHFQIPKEREDKGKMWFNISAISLTSLSRPSFSQWFSSSALTMMWLQNGSGIFEPWILGQF